MAPCLIAFLFQLYLFPVSLRMAAPSEDRVLLPTDVVPSKYFISLTPDLKNFTFEGKENVDVEVKRSTDKLVIHSLDTKVSKNMAHFMCAVPIIYHSTLDSLC